MNNPNPTLIVLLLTIFSAINSEQLYFPLNLHKNFDLNETCLSFQKSNPAGHIESSLVKLRDR